MSTQSGTRQVREQIRRTSGQGEAPASPACCSGADQEACCGPDDKATCCGAGCGCQ